MTEPPPPGYRLLYTDEADQKPIEEFDSWMIYVFGRWRTLSDCEPPVVINPGWSYAVPIDWVRPKTVPELLAEIAALRAEVAELKRHLNPPVEATTPTECGYACP